MKKIISFILTLATCVSLSVTSSAEVITENNEIELIFENGTTEYEITPFIHDYFTVDVTGTGWVTVRSDSNLFTEDVTIKISALSKNITSVDVKIEPHRKENSIIFEDLKNGDTTPIHRVGAGVGYTVKVKVNTGTVSETSKGTITIFWSDAN